MDVQGGKRQPGGLLIRVQSAQAAELPLRKTWVDHADSWTELPIPVLRHLPPSYYRWRWRLLQPLGRRILWGRTSIGAVLAAVLVLGIAAAWAAATWNDVAGSGNGPAVLLLVTWTLAAHSSIWTLVLGLSFERAIGWHQYTVWLAVATGVYHGIVAERDWWKPNTGGPANASQGNMQHTNTQGDRQHLVTGWILLGLMGGMILTSLPPIRRHLWNCFYYVHVLLSLVIIVVGIIHSASLILGGVALWAIDVLYRYFYVSRHVISREATIRRLDANVVRVTFAKSPKFEYSGGQWVFLQVPQVSLLEWHPFSISSHPQESDVMLHVRVLGDWTAKLAKIAAMPEIPGQPAPAVPVKVHIEGPYGSPQIDLSSTRYQLFLLVSGGIGITPMQSIVNDLLAQQKEGRPIKKIWFIWSVRDRAMVTQFMAGHNGSSKPRLTRQSSRLPRSFVPDLVETNLEDAQPPPSQAAPSELAASDAILQAQYHLTQVRNEADFAAADIRPEEQTNLTFGRPDLPALFDKIRAVAESYGERRVAALVCGPGGMIREVQRLSLSKSDRAVRFDCHAEVFQL